MLAAHDLFSLLDGNPFAIKTAASLYKNSFLTNATDLIGVYERLRDENEDSDDDL